MVGYRRMRVPDGTFFFTVTLRDRRSALLTVRIDDLRAAKSCITSRQSRVRPSALPGLRV